MKVELISYSQPSKKFLDETGMSSVADLVSYCARVSNPSNQSNKETSEKLINYLIKNNHWSPMEVVNVCLSITTTRDIARQILRHRSFSFQEFSQRYAVADLGFEFREARLQDTKNRQNSIEITTEEIYTSDHAAQLVNSWRNKQESLISHAKETYNWAIEHGVAKEQARAVLPEGMTVSRLYMNGTLRSWLHYIQIRSDAATQKEHREIALACADAIEPIFPMIKEFTNV